MVENLLSKMYIEGALMSKSRNIALIQSMISHMLAVEVLQSNLINLKSSSPPSISNLCHYPPSHKCIHQFNQRITGMSLQQKCWVTRSGVHIHLFLKCTKKHTKKQLIAQLPPPQYVQQELWARKFMSLLCQLIPPAFRFAIVLPAFRFAIKDFDSPLI